MAEDAIQEQFCPFLVRSCAGFHSQTSRPLLRRCTSCNCRFHEGKKVRNRKELRSNLLNGNKKQTCRPLFLSYKRRIQATGATIAESTTTNRKIPITEPASALVFSFPTCSRGNAPLHQALVMLPHLHLVFPPLAQ